MLDTARSPGRRLPMPITYDRKVAYDRDNVGDRDQSGVSLHVDWNTAVGRFASITAYREFEWTNMETTTSPCLNMLSTGISEDQQQFSQEFRLVSQSGGPFEYVAGLYYEDQTLDTVSRAIVGPDLGVYPDEVIADIFADVESSGWAAYAQGTTSSRTSGASAPGCGIRTRTRTSVTPRPETRSRYCCRPTR